MPAFPNDRIGFILEDAAVKAIASVSRFREKLAEFAVPKIFFDAPQRKWRGKPTSRLSEEAYRERRSALLRHLHLWHDGQAQGRRDRPCGHLQLRESRR